MVGADALSLSTIVKTAEPGDPSVAPPVALLSVRLTVSSGSTAVSSVIGTVKVCDAASPLAQLRVLLAAVAV